MLPFFAPGCLGDVAPIIGLLLSFQGDRLASRVETIPEDFLEHLRMSIPGFSSETEDHQFALAKMAWLGATKRKQHSQYKGLMTFSAVELEENFGRKKFVAVNERLDFFWRTADWSQAMGTTRGYGFSKQVREAIAQYLGRPRGTSVTRLLMADGKALRHPPAAVSSKDSDGVTTTAWTGANALNLVAVDLEELELLKMELQGDCDAHKARSSAEGASEFPELAAVENVLGSIGRIVALAHTPSAGLGVVAHHYVESPSGRLYPVGISLASAPGLVKAAALVGQWEYDISNCHFAIIEQMARKHGYVCAAINHYLLNKAAVRKQLACQAGITEEQAKTCLLALLYGASLTTWHRAAIASEIGSDAVSKLRKSPEFCGLHADIAGAMKLVLSKCDRTSKGWIRNAFGKTIEPAAKKSQQFAHLLQGAEAKALQAAVNLHPDQIVLVQHDGFVAKVRLDTGALSAAIYAATGYELTLEERKLRPLPGDYFVGRL